MENRKEITYPSANKEQQISAYIYYPNTDGVKGIVQISHGMCEHIERYEEFISFLTDKGFAVCGNDHAGHGASHNGVKGYFGKRDGQIHLIEDMYTLKKRMARELPGIPYFILGHSMGSFLLRLYITRWGSELDGILLSGTGHPGGLMRGIYAFGIFFSNVMIRIKGPYAYGKLFEMLSFGVYRRHFKPLRTVADWQTRDEAKADEFINDKRCRFSFTYSGYRDILTLMRQVCNPLWPRKVPKNLPIYIFSGDDDPVGGYGKEVKGLYLALKNAGVKDLSCRLYTGGRHEMLNEINREEVFADIYQWLNKKRRRGPKHDLSV